MIDTVHTPIDEWGLASVNNELDADDVHVWRASLDQPADVIAELAPLLSSDECHRAERFRRPTDRWRFIAGRGILRKIISTYLARTTSKVQFVFNKYGKPFISTDQNLSFAKTSSDTK